MTVSSRINEAYGAQSPDQLVTAEFASLAEFAGFGEYEAAAVQETGQNIPALSERIARQISGYVMTRPEFTSLITGSSTGVRSTRRSSGSGWTGRLLGLLMVIWPSWYGDWYRIERARGHLPRCAGPDATQLVLALTAWVQGEVLSALGSCSTRPPASAAGAAWMNQFMLQLGIMLEPCLDQPR